MIHDTTYIEENCSQKRPHLLCSPANCNFNKLLNDKNHTYNLEFLEFLTNRPHEVGLCENFLYEVNDPQGMLDPEINVKWPAMDGLLNGVNGVFGFNTTSPPSTQYGTADSRATENSSNNTILAYISKIMDSISSTMSTHFAIELAAIVALILHRRFNMSIINKLVYVLLGILIIKALVMPKTDSRFTVTMFATLLTAYTFAWQEGWHQGVDDAEVVYSGPHYHNTWTEYKVDGTTEKHLFTKSDPPERFHPEVDVTFKHPAEPQGSTEKFDAFSNCILALASSYSGYTAKGKIIDGMLNATKVHPNQTKNVTSLFIYSVQELHKFFKAINLDNIADYFEMDLTDDIYVTSFDHLVSEFIVDIDSGSLNNNAMYADMYNELIKKGEKLIKKFPTSSYEFRLVESRLKDLRKVHDKVRHMSTSLNGMRVEPVGVLFAGGPGIHKSLLAERFIDVIASATLPGHWYEDYLAEPKDFIYPMPKEKFWAGYTNKAWVTTIDDLFQKRDNANADVTEATRIMSMINTMAYPLEMAAIEEKNNNFFRSSFVVATTNVGIQAQPGGTFRNIESITCSSALERRFHLSVNVRVNPKYMTGDKVDYSLLNDMFILDEENPTFKGNDKLIPDDFWIFDVYEWNSNSRKHMGDIDFEGLCKLAVNRFDSHNIRHLKNKEQDRKLTSDVKNTLRNRSSFINNHITGFAQPQSGLVSGLVQMVDVNNTSDNNAMSFRILEYWECYSSLSEVDKIRFADGVSRITMATPGVFEIQDYTIHDYIMGYLSLLSEKEVQELLDEFLSSDDGITKFLRRFSNHCSTNGHAGRCPFTGRYYAHSIYLKKKSTMLSTIQNMFTDAVAFVWEHKYVLLTFSAIIASFLYVAIKLFRMILPADPQSIDLEKLGAKQRMTKSEVIKRLGNFDRNVVAVPHGYVSEAFNYDVLPKLTPMSFDGVGNSKDVICSVMNKYMFILYLIEHPEKGTDFTTHKRLGHCLNVTGNLFMVPMHFMFLLDKVQNKPEYNGAQLLFITPTKSTKYIIHLSDLIKNFHATEESANADICIIKLPMAHRTSIGAKNFFLKSGDVMSLKRVTGFDVCLTGSRYAGQDNKILVLRNSSCVGNFTTGTIVQENWTGSSDYYALEETVTYKTTVTSGDCGSLLYVPNSRFENRCIIGMHVAGRNSGEGYSNIITQEYLEKLISECFPSEKPIFKIEEEFKNMDLTDTIVNQGNLQPTGIVHKSYVPAERYDTEICKSVLHSKLPGDYKIVKMVPTRKQPYTDKDGNLHDPFRKSLSNYGKNPGCILELHYKQAINSYKNLVIQNSNVSKEGRTLLTLYESIHGYNRLGPINSGTSPGYPMILPNHENLKKSYYKEVSENIDFNDNKTLKRVAEVVSECLLKYKSGIRVLWIYKDTGKDEKLDILKVLDDKLRLFSASPWILLILMRMYFGAFMADFIDMSISVGSAVGVNPYSDQWSSIAKNLLKFSFDPKIPCIGAGDYKNFDGHEQPYIMNGILDIIQDWYGYSDAESTHIRSCLWAEITNSKHIFRDEFYVWSSSLPSGNPLTTLVNTMYNNIVFRVSFGVAGLPIMEFNDHVFMICLGDDVTFTVSSKYSEVFNEMNLPEFMLKCGMTYTTETKNSASYKFRKITEVEFLRRSFRFDKTHNTWLAPLRESSIIETQNWTKKGLNGTQITVDNISWALREFSLHGEDVFNYWKVELIALYTQFCKGYKPKYNFLLDYDVALHEVLQTSDFQF